MRILAGCCIALLSAHVGASPLEPSARLGEAKALLDQKRGQEALIKLKELARTQPDIATYEVMLRACETACSPVSRAMTAEEAVTRHPDHEPFILATVRALLDVEAQEQAIQMLAHLPKARQNQPAVKQLQARILEMQGRLAEAYALYLEAGADSHHDRSRLAALALPLNGQHYFPPSPWRLTHAGSNEIFDPENDIAASLILVNQGKPAEVLRQRLAEFAPLSTAQIDEMLASPAQTSEEKTSALWILDLSPLTELNGAQFLALEPDKIFAGLFPSYYAAARPLKVGILVATLRGQSDKETARAALRTLLASESVAKGD